MGEIAAGTRITALVRIGMVLAAAAVTMLGGCAVPASPARTASASRYESPSTGSLIAGGDASERIGNNGDPSFYQPQHGYGAAGTALNPNGR